MKLTILLCAFLFETADDTDKVAFFLFRVFNAMLKSIDLGGRRGFGVCKCANLGLQGGMGRS